jgi:hypothetical protein
MMAETDRLNPLMRQEALEAADEAACKLDGMFRDLFNDEERMDLIVAILRAATRVGVFGLPAVASEDRQGDSK